MKPKIHELAQKLTAAQAGVVAIQSGFAHDGRELPGKDKALDQALAAAIEAGELARQIREGGR